MHVGTNLLHGMKAWDKALELDKAVYSFYSHIYQLGAQLWKEMRLHKARPKDTVMLSLAIVIGKRDFYACLDVP